MVKSLGKRLKKLREEKDVRQEDVALFIGVTPEAVGNYEKGKREPKGIILINLANYFNVSTDYLLGLSEIIYRSDDMTDIGIEWVEVVKESTGAGYTPKQVREILKNAEGIAESFRASPLSKKGN